MPTPREVMDQMKQAIRDGDLDSLFSCYAPDAVMIIPSGVHTGKPALEEYWTQDLTTYTQTTIDFRLQTELGDTVVDEWTMESLNTTNGEREPLRGVDIAKFLDGLVIEHRWYYDT